MPMTLRRDHKVLRSHPQDLLLCVVVAILVIAAILGFEAAWGADAFLRWGGFLAFSLLFFWRAIGLSKRRTSPEFRNFVLLFILAHTAAWIALLVSLTAWRLPWFALMFIEVPIYSHLYSNFFAKHGA